MINTNLTANIPDEYIISSVAVGNGFSYIDINQLEGHNVLRTVYYDHIDIALHDQNNIGIYAVACAISSNGYWYCVVNTPSNQSGYVTIHIRAYKN